MPALSTTPPPVSAVAVTRVWMHRLLPLTVIAAVGIFQSLTIRPGHDWGDDFALYILHARNLVEGRPYFDTGYVVNPGNVMIAPGPYPPVLPLLLAPVYAARGLDYEAMKLVVIAFFVLSLWAIDLSLRDALSLPQRLALLAIFGLTPYCTAFKNSVLSEFPFIFFVYLSLTVARRLERGALAGKGRWLAGAALGLLMYLAYATRTAGVVLPVALALAMRGKPRPVVGAGCVALALFAALFAAQGRFISSGGSYGATLSTLTFNFPAFLIEVLRVSFFMLGRDLPAFWGQAAPPFLTAPLAVLTGLLAVFGYVREFRRGLHIHETFVAVFLAMTLLWPALKDLRFYLPVLPLYLYYVLRGGSAVLEILPARPAVARGLAAAGGLAVAVSFLLAYADTPLRRPISPGVTDARAVELFEYLKARVRPGDAIIFPKPKALALYTGRRSAAAHYADDAELFRYFDEIGAACLVAPSWSADMGPFLTSLARRHPERFDAERVGGNEFLVLWLRRDTTAP